MHLTLAYVYVDSYTGISRPFDPPHAVGHQYLRITVENQLGRKSRDIFSEHGADLRRVEGQAVGSEQVVHRYVGLVVCVDVVGLQERVAVDSSQCA